MPDIFQYITEWLAPARDILVGSFFLLLIVKEISNIKDSTKKGLIGSLLNISIACLTIIFVLLVSQVAFE